jgi:hypothetical protein
MTNKKETLSLFSGFTPDSQSYREERDGDLYRYLYERFEQLPLPLFRGYEDFKMLQDLGLLMPGVSYIRIMWNIGREDEHYLINENFMLEGMTGAAHSGDEGIFDPKEKLGNKNSPENFNWELNLPNFDKICEMKDRNN